MASKFAQELDNATVREDGIAVSRLLSIAHSNLKALSVSTNEAMVDSEIGQRLRDPNWGQVAVAFWRVSVQVVLNEDLVAAYAAQNNLLIAANRVAEKTDNWVLPVLSTIAKELRQLSIMADGKSGSREKLEEATRTINRSFTICLNDRNLEIERSKKWGVYNFVGELFKVYFRLDKQPLAKSVVKVLHTMTKDLPPLDDYLKSNVVTYLYYWGVLLFIDQDYAKAEEKLTEAFEKCYHKSVKNKEQILLYLIPARLINTQTLPSKEHMLDKYPRLQTLFGEIIQAMKRGDIKQFDLLIEKRRSVFIKKYLFTCIQHLRLLTSCALLRRIYQSENKNTRIEVQQYVNGLNYFGYFDQDTSDDDKKDEAECLVATMISHGQVKGYISHERRIIVLSNKTPFPTLG